jgi:hypothetical protein
MSLSNILQPNDYNLFCNSITTADPFTPTTTVFDTRFINSANQTIPSSAVTTIIFDAVVTPPSDEPPLPYTFNNFDSFTITADRVTLNITLEVSWGSNASTGTGSRIIAFRRNNDAYYVAQNAITSNALPAPPSAVQMLSLSLVMQQGDKFHFDVLQSTGNLLDLISASSNPTSFCLLNIVSVY